MLKRSRRIPGYKVKQLLSAPVVKKDGGLTIKAADNNLSYSRFAVVVPKKTTREAVDRNRLKRQTMGTIENNLKDYEPGKDYLILVYEAPHSKAN